MDHIVIFADGSIGRPWLTAIQDIGTNEILGYTLSREKRSTYPGSQAIGLTLRQAILRKDKSVERKGLRSDLGPQSSKLNAQSSTEWPSFGLFENFYTDLGKDFRSQFVRAVCHDLNIRVRYTRGYHGKSKPIERWFGVLEDGLRRLPGYVGRSTETNPLKQVIGAPRAWEDMRGEIMTIDQFAAALYKWIVFEFHHAESRALRGYSPVGLLEKHIKEGWTAREVTNERALDLLMMSRAGKKVQRMGVQMFSSAHTQRFFMAPELAPLIGQDVQVFWNPEKIGEIVVYANDRFVCVAQNRELLDFGASEQDLAREREIKKAQKESVRARHQQLLIYAQYPNEMAQVAAEKRLAQVEVEEKEKIAVNAAAPGVAVLLPKYHHAAKQLQAIGNRQQAIGRSSDSDVSLKACPEQGRRGAKALRVEEDELRSSEDLFAPEDYGREDQLKSSEELFGHEED